MEKEEIEITKEMIDAGATALATYSTTFESTDEAVERIFVAMTRAGNRRRRRPSLVKQIYE